MRHPAVLAAGLALATLAGASNADAQGRTYIPGNELGVAFNDLCTVSSTVTQSAGALKNGANFLLGLLGVETLAQESTQNVNWLAQTQHNLCAYRAMFSQYRQLVYQTNALTGSRDVVDFMRRLGGASRTYLPVAQQMAAALGSGASVVLNGGDWFAKDEKADPQNIDGSPQMQYWLDEMLRRKQTNASVKAIAEAGMNDVEERILQLEEAQHTLSNSQDISELNAAHATIKVAGDNLQMHNLQIQQANLMLTSEQHTLKARMEQNWVEGAVKYEQNSIAAWGGGIPR